MISRNYIRNVISIIAVVCNVVLFCLLIYEIFEDLPALSDFFIALAFGVFLVLNVVAIVLASRGVRKSVQTSSSLPKVSRKARLIGLIVALLVCIVAGFWIGFRSHVPIMMWKWQRDKQAKLEKFMGKKAPDIVAQTLDGTEWRLQDQHGKVVLIEFWATWCGPCVATMPETKEIYEKYKAREDFVVIGVSLDHDKDKLIQFCEKQEISWPQLFEPEKGWESNIAKAFEVRGVPSVWVIDKEGNVVGMDIHSSNREEIEGIVERSLDGLKSASDL